MYCFDNFFVILLALGYLNTLLPNMITTIVPLPFWQKSNYISFIQKNEKKNLICTKILIK
jgi:hypothetical protein